MRSGSERMHTWRKTPSTGRNFQTLIIWITVSLKRQVVMVQFLSIIFFLGFLQFLLGFSKVSVFCVTLYLYYSVVPSSFLHKNAETVLCNTTRLFPPSSHNHMFKPTMKFSIFSSSHSPAHRSNCLLISST